MIVDPDNFINETLKSNNESISAPFIVRLPGNATTVPTERRGRGRSPRWRASPARPRPRRKAARPRPSARPRSPPGGPLHAGEEAPTPIAAPQDQQPRGQGRQPRHGDHQAPAPGDQRDLQVDLTGPPTGRSPPRPQRTVRPARRARTLSRTPHRHANYGRRRDAQPA